MNKHLQIKDIEQFIYKLTPSVDDPNINAYVDMFVCFLYRNQHRIACLYENNCLSVVILVSSMFSEFRNECDVLYMDVHVHISLFGPKHGHKEHNPKFYR